MDSHAVALAALAETLAEPRRAQRFLDVTGIGTDELRERAGEGDVLAAVIQFLEAHEPDLIDVANGLGLTAAQLVDARRTLEA